MALNYNTELFDNIDYNDPCYKTFFVRILRRNLSQNLRLYDDSGVYYTAVLFCKIGPWCQTQNSQ